MRKSSLGVRFKVSRQIGERLRNNGYRKASENVEALPQALEQNTLSLSPIFHHAGSMPYAVIKECVMALMPLQVRSTRCGSRRDDYAQM